MVRSARQSASRTTHPPRNLCFSGLFLAHAAGRRGNRGAWGSGRMLHVLLHVMPGLIGLVLATGIVLRLGDRDQKTVMTAVLVCWLGATAGQILTGHLTAPLVAGDVVFAIWLVWFAYRHPAWWVWTLFAVEGARLVLHATQYGQAWLPYATINNTLSLGALALLAVAAVLGWRKRRAETPDEG